jgi:hypothetical protein
MQTGASTTINVYPISKDRRRHACGLCFNRKVNASGLSRHPSFTSYDFLPQVVETNPPQPMDVTDAGLLYDLIEW